MICEKLTCLVFGLTVSIVTVEYIWNILSKVYIIIGLYFAELKDKNAEIKEDLFVRILPLATNFL